MTSKAPDIFYEYEYFTLENLDSVFPVGRTQKIEDFELTLLSIERYRHGFLALLLAETDRSSPETQAEFESWTPPPLYRGSLMIRRATDNHDTQYIARERFGHGGGRSNGSLEMRLGYAFAPALANDAQSLTLTLEIVDPSKREVLGGPWTVAFELTPSDGSYARGASK